MSAFFIGEDHVNAMLTAAKALGMYQAKVNQVGWDRDPRYLSDNDWTAIGRELLTENCRSLAARYPSDWQDMLPERCDHYDINQYQFVEDLTFLTRHKLTDAIHLVDCYDYQTCEHDGWPDSWAHDWCQRLTKTAARSIPESARCWPYSKPADSNLLRIA